MSDKKYKYSEIFGETFQGEGKYCGTNTVWVRWYRCNFTCHMFGQSKDPAKQIDKKDMYYEKLDPTTFERIEDLPIENIGCDSYYSWNGKFQHLISEGTADEIADLIIEKNKNEYNPEGLFVHPRSGQDIHLCFTGGESMMSQNGITEVLEVLKSRGNYPLNVTIETNGTQRLRDYFCIPEGINLFWSCSPKMESVTGMEERKAVKPEVLKSYQDYSEDGQLKFVCDNTELAWAEIENAIAKYREAGVTWSVCIMAEGADASAQHRHDANIAIEAIKRGYNFTGRLHAILFGSQVGK